MNFIEIRYKEQPERCIYINMDWVRVINVIDKNHYQIMYVTNGTESIPIAYIDAEADYLRIVDADYIKNEIEKKQKERK